MHNLEVWRTPPFIVCFHPLYQSTLFSGKMWTPTLLQSFKISNPHPLKCVDCQLWYKSNYPKTPMVNEQTKQNKEELIKQNNKNLKKHPHTRPKNVVLPFSNRLLSQTNKTKTKRINHGGESIVNILTADWVLFEKKVKNSSLFYTFEHCFLGKQILKTTLIYWLTKWPNYSQRQI